MAMLTIAKLQLNTVQKAASSIYDRYGLSCHAGFDDLFGAGARTPKSVRNVREMLATASLAHTLYGVSQVLRWAAIRLTNAEKRLDWKAGVVQLIAKLVSPDIQSGGRNRKVRANG